MKKGLIGFSVTVFLIFALETSSQGAPIFKNGSFENFSGDVSSPYYTDLYDNVMLDGWTTSNDLNRLDVFSSPGYNASDGNVALRIHGIIDQAIQVVSGFISGGLYILSFDLAAASVWHDTPTPFWGNGSTNTQGVHVYANGINIGSVTTGVNFDFNSVFGNNPFNYKNYSMPFIANFSDIEFRFDVINIDEQGVALDNLTISPVPVPSTLLLFGTGIVGLAGTRLRKKKK